MRTLRFYLFTLVIITCSAVVVRASENGSVWSQMIPGDLSLKDLYALGLGGVILAVVVLPILRWMFVEMRSARESYNAELRNQREGLANVVLAHYEREEALFIGLRTELEKLTSIIGRLNDSLFLQSQADLKETRDEVRRLREIIGQFPYSIPRPQPSLNDPRAS